MGFELYNLHAEMNGTGFPLSYLFVENNGQCKGGIRTGILQRFLTIFRNRGLNPTFFLTDKDFAQINAARFTWPHSKIQLCKWHIKRAVFIRLSSNKITTRSSGYNPLSEFGVRFPFRGIEQASQFCPKELREIVWSIMEKHLHQHPLIPNVEGQFLTKNEIYEAAVEEMYTFCKENALISLWMYLWTEWYDVSKWLLWARSPCEDKLSVLKTTMFIEGHWRTIKRDFLYKFFRPRMDLVVYILMEKVVAHQERKLQQIYSGVERPEWIKSFKSEWKKLSGQPINHTYITNLDQWICGCPYYLTSRFNICKHLIHQKGRVLPEFFNQIKRNWQPPFLAETVASNDTNIYITPNIEQLADVNNNITSNVDDAEDDNISVSFDELINTTRKALDLLEEQNLKGNIRWCKGVKRYFDPLSRLVTDVEQYRRKRTMPLTWRGHNDSTRYLQ